MFYFLTNYAKTIAGGLIAVLLMLNFMNITFASPPHANTASGVYDVLSENITHIQEINSEQPAHQHFDSDQCYCTWCQAHLTSNPFIRFYAFDMHKQVPIHYEMKMIASYALPYRPPKFIL
jgi:hypothetical protein